MSGQQVLTPTPANNEVRMAQKIQELERRLADIERRGVILPLYVGVPSGSEGAENQIILTNESPTIRLRAKVAGVWTVV